MKKWMLYSILLLVMLCGVSFLPPIVYLFGALAFFVIGNSEYKKGSSPAITLPGAAQTMGLAPAQPAATAAVQLPEREMPDNLPKDMKCSSCGANIKPSDKKCEYCNSTLQPLIELPEPAKLSALAINQSVRINHPQKGEQPYRLRGCLLYTELWQATRGPSIPWTPTGNYYAGFALEPHGYLLNWQERYYLLEEQRTLTDMDINRDFMPFARQFSQSNQTAQVQIPYAGKRWQIVDIGRFAIEFSEGEGLHLRNGAIGRFVHAASGNQALVLEDFQSGGSGGQDTLWLGFQIQETDIKS